MTSVVALFLVVALSAYVLFGGADFGAGIVEATLPNEKLRKKLQGAMGPVWEANHVWLIAVVVILFVGFPRFYAAVMTRLYVPISLALLGILVRGTFFALRKYDPVPSPWARAYGWAFRLSSFFAPLAFGMVVAGLLAEHPGSYKDPGSAGYYAIYVAPWLDLFGLLCGLFIASLFGFLASVFFYGELHDVSEQSIVHRRGVAFFLGAFVLGGAVLLLGAHSGRVALSEALAPVQIVCQLVAFAAIFVLYWAERNKRTWAMRFAAGAQVLSILTGWFAAQHPAFLKLQHGHIALTDGGAPFITQLWLVIGLVVVLALVIPLLVLLYRVFDRSADSH